MMKAIQFYEFGGPEVLKLEEIPAPTPGPGEVLIKVAGYGVNPVDWKILGGHFMKDAIKFPSGIGFEASGTVVELGQGVNEFSVGDEIFGRVSSGAAQEFATVPINAAAKYPPVLELADSAGLVVPGLTAWQALFDHGGLEAGQRVLIHAAAGGVGSLAVQLAKWKGAYVIATGGPTNEHFVSELGADEYIDYSKQQFEDVVRDVDVVLDSLGGDVTLKSLKTLKTGGILVSIVGPPDVAAFEAEGKRAVGFGMTPQVWQLEKIRDLVEDDKLAQSITAELPLERTAEAIALSMTGRTRGKIIVKVS